MAKRILVTGASGFAGSHLLQYLVNKENEEYFGTYLSQNSLVNLEGIRDKVNLIRIDLVKAEEVSNLIKKVKPDVVFHLAALPSAADSFASPVESVTNNITSQLNVLEAVKNENLIDCRILTVSSGEIYGDVSPKDLPINESVEFRPTNPYAVSKLTQDFLGLQYFLSYNLKTVRVRPFNHIGPRQSPNFVVSSFAKKIVEIEKGKRENVLEVGNLSSKRDFTDVRDMVRAYDLAIAKCEAGEVYNIGSGVSYEISDILNRLLSLSDTKITVEVDKSLFRPIDNQELVCNAAKFKKITGWEPKIKIDKTLKDTLDYWRNII